MGKRTHGRICINPKNTYWQNCSGHVHKSPPCGDVPNTAWTFVDMSNPVLPVGVHGAGNSHSAAWLQTLVFYD